MSKPCVFLPSHFLTAIHALTVSHSHGNSGCNRCALYATTLVLLFTVTQETVFHDQCRHAARAVGKERKWGERMRSKRSKDHYSASASAAMYPWEYARKMQQLQARQARTRGKSQPRVHHAFLADKRAR